MIYSSGIYKLYWDNTPYFYIGKSEYLCGRRNSHFTNLKNRNGQSKIQEIYNMYGKPAFKVIEYCPLNDLNKLEASYIDSFSSNPYLLNTHIPCNLKNEKYPRIYIRVSKEEYDLFAYFKSKKLSVRNVLALSSTPCEHCNTESVTAYSHYTGDPIEIPRGIISKRK